LDGSYTIVLENQAVLSGVCGANDGNLRVIEDVVGGVISSRGNELSLRDADEAAQALFRVVVDRLAAAVKGGETPPRISSKPS
jgi:phosphate starvation-inducible PhoH-like protein